MQTLFNSTPSSLSRLQTLFSTLTYKTEPPINQPQIDQSGNSNQTQIIKPADTPHNQPNPSLPTRPCTRLQLATADPSIRPQPSSNIQCNPGHAHSSPSVTPSSTTDTSTVMSSCLPPVSVASSSFPSLILAP